MALLLLICWLALLCPIQMVVLLTLVRKVVAPSLI
jgi:hypothetical protein